ncbi:LEA type 2 family protein [Pseudogulbenkiania sp. MAI-1]|uniref:LEA type 2 family protein n=1 Tax=Pseudogulbenkiania sp. MAI-1 TaxID=990370 RepID=UPI00045EC682|nr:LEA type 2 family protein [Pseudogulbenkiania sp. MAI-1]
MRILKLLLLTLLLTACASLSWQKPEVSIADIQPGKSTLFEQTFTLTLRVQNPNNRPLTAQGLVFDVAVAGEKLARGVSPQAIEVPPLSDSLIQVELHTSTRRWLKQIGRLLERPDSALDYEINGQLQGLNGLGTLPFSSKGEWHRPR